MIKRGASKFLVFGLSLALALSIFLQQEPIEARANERSVQGHSSWIISNSLQAAATGLISGELSFPSERIPALTIFAIRIDNGKNTYYSIQTEENQSSYSIRVDPGVYNLLAYDQDFSGGYTFYAKCSLGYQCRNHALAPVVVESGAVISGANILDWYAPSGVFPTRPDGKTFTGSPVTCSSYHTIKYGETLYRIGLMYDMTWTPIALANDIARPDRIYAGQVLCIPSTGRPSSPDTSSSIVPTFEITSVDRNKQVTIKTYNFPPDTEFVVTMGQIGTRGIGGKQVARTDSGNGGSFTATYKIPNKFHDLGLIAIRLQGSNGYYSYNWFCNSTTK